MTVADVSAPVRPAWVFMLPPPLYFGLAFGAGVLLQHFIPLAFANVPGRLALGIAILLMGVVAGPVLAATFLVRGTTLNPYAAPTAFLEEGVYRLSRNPMYLGVILVYLGGCFLAASLWPVLLLVVPVTILNHVVIPFEEASMRQAFGAAYDAYCARVRRWL